MELKIGNTSIPLWANYYVRLGTTIAQLVENNPSADDPTMNLAISAPTRQYASTFINLGIQIGMRGQIISSFDKDTYFSDIKATPENSELRYYEKPHLNCNSKKRIFIGTETDDQLGELLLLQDKRNPNIIDKVNAARSYCVLKDGQQGIKTLKSIIQLLESIGDKSNIRDAIAYTFSNRANIAAIGQINSLTEENSLSIGIQKDDVKSEISLQEITRIRTQTLLLSSMRDETTDKLNEEQPPVIVYESLSAANKYDFLDYSPRIRVYLVDRSAPTSRDYRTCIEDHYISREPLESPEIPAPVNGIETLSFYRY